MPTKGASAGLALRASPPDNGGMVMLEAVVVLGVLAVTAYWTLMLL